MIFSLLGRATVCLSMLLYAGQTLAADQEASVASKGYRHLVIMAGLPGDDEYRSRFTEVIKQIATASPDVLQINADRTRVFLSDEEMVEQLKGDFPTSTVCTSSNLREYFVEQARAWGEDDSVWLVMIGHSQSIENRSYFNVQGKDFTAEDLATWIKALPCRQQVTFLTMPASGTWLGAMKSPGRINIAATDSFGEATGTEYPYALASVLSGKHSYQALTDLDKDGRLSLLDLYLAVSLEVHGIYQGMERLCTEHAQLDDNGDGKPKEIQEPLIPVAPDDEDAEKVKQTVPALVITQNSDGAAARAIGLKTSAER